MDPIMNLAREKDLWVVEDCAQANGATYKGRQVGSMGDVAAFSFCQDKIITTGGEGGMVTIRARQGNDFSEFLKANGVEVLTQFRKPYYKHEALKLEDRGFPETEALSREVCSLPMNVEIEDSEVDYVIEVVRKFYGK